VCAKLGPSQLVWLRVVPVAIDAIEHNLKLALIEALQFIAGKHRIRKANDEEVPAYGDADCRSTFDTTNSSAYISRALQSIYQHENPSPSGNAMHAIQLDNCPCQDVSERGNEQIDEIPPTHTLLDLKTLIPSTQQEHAAWEESSFKYADEHAADHNQAPIVDPAHTQHDSSPTNRKAIEQVLRPNRSK
jgi:hypothetical protein